MVMRIDRLGEAGRIDRERAPRQKGGQAVGPIEPIADPG